MDPTARLVAAGLFFVTVLLSGIWLSRKGRPLNMVLSAVHKLVSLATGIYLLMVIYQRSRVVPLGSAEWSAITPLGVDRMEMPRPLLTRGRFFTAT